MEACSQYPWQQQPKRFIASLRSKSRDRGPVGNANNEFSPFDSVPIMPVLAFRRSKAPFARWQPEPTGPGFAQLFEKLPLLVGKNLVQLAIDLLLQVIYLLFLVSGEV